MIQFDAEIIEIKVKKTAEIERMYRIVMETNQPSVLELQKFIAQDTVKVKVEDGK